MRIFFTVTNDLTFDQRMIRICSSLANAGYDVVLVGRIIKNSKPLSVQPFQQKRLKCIFNKGPLFYAEFNTRLFLYLLRQKMDAVCAIDLDTILPCYFISKRKNIVRIYDAHELFCEMKEIVSRPRIYKIWKRVEKFSVPKFPNGYTVNQPIADEFKKMYKVEYAVVRSIARLKEIPATHKTCRFILYQGAVNEGRSFETLIPAMKHVNVPLVICGDGNFLEQSKDLVKLHHLEDKVIFKGKLLPDELRQITLSATIGLTLFDDKGLSNYYSLANRFFDYIHSGIPQLCVNYPVYREINQQFEVAFLIDDLSPENIASSLNKLLDDRVLYNRLTANCYLAREKLNWQEEEKILLQFYSSLFKH